MLLDKLFEGDEEPTEAVSSFGPVAADRIMKDAQVQFGSVRRGRAHYHQQSCHGFLVFHARVHVGAWLWLNVRRSHRVAVRAAQTGRRRNDRR